MSRTDKTDPPEVQRQHLRPTRSDWPDMFVAWRRHRVTDYLSTPLSRAQEPLNRTARKREAMRREENS